MFGFMIWSSSNALFDNAKFSWYNLIDILFINKLKFAWSSKGECVLKKRYNWKTGAYLRKKTPQFKITLTCTMINLTLMLSKSSYLVRFHVKFCLIINLLIFAWHLKFLSLKIVFLRYIEPMQTTTWHKLCLHNKKLSAVYLAYNFKNRQSHICWSSEMPHLSIGTITIRKKVWHISWQCHFKIVRNDYQSNF